jgi:SPP1 family predicted phage head-tail adaptor
MYIPPEAKEMTTPVLLYKKVETKTAGATTISYQIAEEPLLFCNIKTFGGTESTNAGMLTIITTAQITTWYKPDVAYHDKLKFQDGTYWRIISEPENIEMRNQYMKMKCEKVAGL